MAELFDAKIGAEPEDAASILVLTNAFVAEKLPAFDFQIFFTRLPFLSVTSVDSAVISILASLMYALIPFFLKLIFLE